MCGIAGVISLKDRPYDCRAAVDSMTSALVHRGPDDAGLFFEGRVGLGHRRLSIIDPSTSGHQPMVSADGRLVLVFNGEIYNFRDLRSKLNYPFQSHTDTEVLLAAWQCWGPACIEKLSGMYAFAVWDRARKELHLVRDRLGVKPLYYFQDEERFLFSSEVRSLLASGLIPRKMDTGALIDFLRYQCVHQPETMVEGVRMLGPGTHAVLAGSVMSVKPYWSLVQAVPSERLDADTAKRRVLDALFKAVEKRLVSDVPFGAFLSGGIDSSAIVALMSRVIDKVNTFSVSFSEQSFSEAPYARMVAQKFGTDHHEVQLSAQDFLRLVPDALECMDHPSGDGPNTYVVSGATKQAGITMALSGLGGDELFAGYPIFRKSLRLRRLSGLNALPRLARRAAGRLLEAARPGVATMKAGAILDLPRISMLSAYPINRQVFMDHQIMRLLNERNLPPNRVAALAGTVAEDPLFITLPLLSQVSILEISTYMQNVLLRDTDQMSMAHALEVRVPFLDHELVELVLGMPDAIKYPHTPKRLLIESLGDLLPPAVVNRPKMGFMLPYRQWMKRELRSFCAERLRRLGNRAPFDGRAVRGYWEEFLSGSPYVPWSRIWALVVLGHWLETNRIQ